MDIGVYDLAATVLIGALIGLLLLIPSALISLKAYYHFYTQHTEFYRISPGLKHRTLYMRLPVPWRTERTFYLLDHHAQKKLFASTPALDSFALARRLHWKVWRVPPEPYKETLRQAAKDILKALSARNLSQINKEFEEAISEHIAVLRSEIGQRRPVPLHTTLYRLAYAGNAKAVLGPDFPVDETRVYLQTFSIHLRALNTTPSLPILPTEWWNNILPSARKGKKARDALTNALMQWELNGGLKSCSDTWRACFGVIRDRNVPYEHAARWVNMTWNGFVGNTGEQPGWMLIHLLQSPELWKLIKAEVGSLPAGSLADVEFKKATPYMFSAIHETLRLCTAVFAGRETKVSTKVEGCDTVFPKGVLIRAMSRAASFDGRVWGADPASWKGDRFVLNPSLYGKELYFGGGVSACPGRHFALAELCLIMAHVILNFDFEPATLHMENRLLPEAPSLALGGRTTQSFRCDIIDVDGTRINGIHAGVADSDNCMESVSGSIFPVVEAVCDVKCL